MAIKKKMAIIGLSDTLIPFRSIGLSAYPVSDNEAAKVALSDAVKAGFGIIYVEEAFAKPMQAEIAEYNKEYKDMSILVIPGAKGGTDYTTERIRTQVKRAIGIDIFAAK